MDDAIHSGHRARMKELYIESGLTGFSEVNALELLLFYAIPRRNTNEIAHALLKKFGTLDEVFDASVQELTEVEGIGENTAILISMIPALMKKAAMGRSKRGAEIRRSSEAAKFLSPFFMGERDEKLVLVCLDIHNRVISAQEIARGDVSEVEVNVRVVAQIAMKARASKVILAHNHPNGSLIPSKLDLVTTENVRDAVERLAITLADHMVITDNGYTSIRDLQVFSGLGY